MTTPVRSVAAAIVLTVAALLVVVSTDAIGAATRITEPAGHTYQVKFDAQGKPRPFDVVAQGFPAGHQVFIEQCNGRPTSAPRWSPTLDCDVGNAPAPVIVDTRGMVRFSATDHNHAFVPVLGPSPSTLFNCVKPNGPNLDNGLTNYTTCQIRVSTNNTQPTDDQVFLSIVFGAGPSGGGGSSSIAIVAIAAGLLVLAAIAARILVRRRRRAVLRAR